MFAVIKTGGKQYRVQAGDVLRVEKLAADAGEKVQFNDVLMLGGDKTVLGAPLVADAAVQAEVVDQVKGDKVVNFVKRRRKHSSKRTVGHRQKLTLLRVTDILPNGAGKTGVKAAIGAAGVSDAVAASKPAAKAEKPAAKAEKNAAPKAKAKAPAADDLTAITGIGPTAAKKLKEAGINSYAELAAVDVDAFEAVKVKPEWVEQAKELAK